MCNRVDKLPDVCDRWNLSISVAKSYWGRRKVAYLGHEVSSAGLEAKPKELDAIANLPFPTKLKAMQSFLGSLNYYSRFIEDFAVYAAILYELREADFHEIARMDAEETLAEDSQVTGGERDRWARAKNAFTMLKAKIIATPVLKHFDPERTPVVVIYADKWAISAALMQEHEGVYHPVTFTSRTLKPNELNYLWSGGQGSIGASANLGCLLLAAGYQIDQGLVAILDIGLAAQVERIRRSTGWAALLSGWTLEVTKCVKGEDEILGTIAASITPRADVDEALVPIAPKKQPRKMITMPPPTIEPDENLWDVSFDGSARVKRSGGAYSSVVWKLPEWTVVEA
ncbi:LOW QUALITY PROTEIN: reverse transcriptase, partial [Phytophthora megakarya]